MLKVWEEKYFKSWVLKDKYPSLYWQCKQFLSFLKIPSCGATGELGRWRRGSRAQLLGRGPSSVPSTTWWATIICNLPEEIRHTRLTSAGTSMQVVHRHLTRKTRTAKVTMMWGWTSEGDRSQLWVPASMDMHTFTRNVAHVHTETYT